MSLIIALDPGRDKCGLAVVRDSGEALDRKVVPTSAILEQISDLASKYPANILVMGSGTYSKQLKEKISSNFIDLEIVTVDESYSTEMAKRLYFEEFPPKGLMKFIPIGLQVPPAPYDDFAAIVLARKYFDSL